MPTNRKLCVIDTSVVTHLLVDLTRDVKGRIINPITNKERDSRLDLGHKAYSSLFWLLGEDADEWDLLWVGDSKEEPYWRTLAVREWLDSLPEDAPQLTKRKGARLGYKGNRNTCPYSQWVAKRAIKFSEPLVFPGYEADDVAASVVMANPDREILLATVDSDWMQLVKDKDQFSEKVSWVCLKGFNPQYRDVKSGVKWFKNKLEKESVQTRKMIDGDDLSQIVQWKMLVGDKSDNLPANTPEEFISLVKPPIGKELWKLPNFKIQVDAAIEQGDYDGIDSYFDFCETYFTPSTKFCHIG